MILIQVMRDPIYDYKFGLFRLTNNGKVLPSADVNLGFIFYNITI